MYAWRLMVQGSHAGARAAHMKVLYPDIVYGAIASSGTSRYPPPPMYVAFFRSLCSFSHLDLNAYTLLYCTNTNFFEHTLLASSRTHSASTFLPLLPLLPHSPSPRSHSAFPSFLILLLLGRMLRRDPRRNHELAIHGRHPAVRDGRVFG